MSNPLLYTEPELADMLKTSQRSLRHARQTKGLPYVQIGRLVRYRLADVMDFLDGATRTSVLEDSPRVTRRSRPINVRQKPIKGFLERDREASL